MNTRNNIYFNLRDHHYYFGEDAFSSEENNDNDIIPVDRWTPQSLDDGSEAALMFVERDKKMGVMTIYKCNQGGYGGVLYSSNIFPLLYDEMLLNGSFNGYGIGYVAVRINSYWGVLRVESIGLSQEKRSRSGKKCIMIIPCMYQTKEEAIERIKSSDFHSEFGWRNPFTEV